ncbi:putative uncharacterized protein DDB_G0282133 isoform X2 [Cephus cinctus]|uniref:Uncharacterized protein n=1 Tax=Cephus cinctus TaxID=211228 RepID=A0AAJ7C4W1_CEPCN|nr:putative uncharacterized protein DDB_G0282133 isoform X2 [Cephus cinctus]
MEEENSKVIDTQNIRILIQNRHIPQEITTNMQVHENRENGIYSSSNSKVRCGSQKKFVNQSLINDSQHLSAKYHISETKKSRNPNELNDTSNNDTRNMVKPHEDKMSPSIKCYPKFISNTCENSITTEVNASVNESSNVKLTTCIASKSETDVQTTMEHKDRQPKIQDSKNMNLIGQKRKSSKTTSKRQNDKSVHTLNTYSLRSLEKAKKRVDTITENPSTNASKIKPKKHKQTMRKKPAKASGKDQTILNGDALTNDELKTLYKKFLFHGHFRANPNLPPFILLLENGHNNNPVKIHCCAPKHCCADSSQTTVSSNHTDKKCMDNLKKSTNNPKESSSENRENIQHQKWKTCNSPVFIDLTTCGLETCDASTNTDVNQLNTISSISNTSQWNPLVSTVNNTQTPIAGNSSDYGYMHCNDTQLMAQSNNNRPFHKIIGLSSPKKCTPSNTWTESPTYSSHALHSAINNQSAINNRSFNKEIPIFNNSTIQSNHSNMLPNVLNATLNNNDESSMNTFQYINPNVFNRHSIFNNFVATTNSNNNVLYNTSHFSPPKSSENFVMNRSNNLVNSGVTVLPVRNNFQTQLDPQTYNNNICYAYLGQQTNGTNIPVNNYPNFLENSMHNVHNANVYLNSPNDYTGTSLTNSIGNIHTQGSGMNSFVMQTDSSGSIGLLPSIHTILPRSHVTGESSVNFRRDIDINKVGDMNNIQGNNCIGNSHMEQNANLNTNIMNDPESYLPILSQLKQDKELSECEKSIGNQDSNTMDSASIDFYLQTQSSKSPDCMIIDSEKPAILQSTKSSNIQQLRQILVDFTKQYPNHQESLYTSNQSERSPDNLERTASCITLD